MITEDADYITISNKYPKIATAIRLMWGFEELEKYIMKLFSDTRDGKRSGFPVEDAACLFKLLQKHHREYPHLSSNDGVWNNVNRR